MRHGRLIGMAVVAGAASLTTWLATRPDVPSLDAPGALARGVALQEAGRFEEASRAYQLAVVQSPERQVDLRVRNEALYRLGLLAYRTFLRPVDALGFLQRIESAGPKDRAYLDALLLTKEISLDASNDCRQAIQTVEQLLADYHFIDDIDGHCADMIDCYFRLGDYGQAVMEGRLFSGRYPQSPHLPRVYLATGRSHAAMNDLQRAELEFRKVADLFPGSYEAMLAAEELGLLAEEKGLLQEALDRYAEALLGHPFPEAIKIKIERLERLQGQNLGALNGLTE